MKKDGKEQIHLDLLEVAKNDHYDHADFFKTLGDAQQVRVEAVVRHAIAFYVDRCNNNMKIKHLQDLLDNAPVKDKLPPTADAALTARMKNDIKGLVGARFCQICITTTHNTDKCCIKADIDKVFAFDPAKKARWGLAKSLSGKKRTHKVFMEQQVGKVIYNQANKFRKLNDMKKVPDVDDKKVIDEYTDDEHAQGAFK